MRTRPVQLLQPQISWVQRAALQRQRPFGARSQRVALRVPSIARHQKGQSPLHAARQTAAVGVPLRGRRASGEARLDADGQGEQAFGRAPATAITADAPLAGSLRLAHSAQVVPAALDGERECAGRVIMARAEQSHTNVVLPKARPRGCIATITRMKTQHKLARSTAGMPGVPGQAAVALKSPSHGRNVVQTQHNDCQHAANDSLLSGGSTSLADCGDASPASGRHVLR